MFIIGDCVIVCFPCSILNVCHCSKKNTFVVTKINDIWDTSIKVNPRAPGGHCNIHEKIDARKVNYEKFYVYSWR